MKSYQGAIVKCQLWNYYEKLKICPSPTGAAEDLVSMPTLLYVHLPAVFFVPLGIFVSDLLERYFLGSIHGTSEISMLRLVRVCRLLYTMRCTRGIRTLLLGFVTSIPALLNIVMVLLLFKVTFALFGMFHFAHITEGPYLDFLNFNAFGISMISMFTVSVSGGWSDLLHPMMHTPPDCDPFKENPGLAVSGNCGQPGLAIAFFAIYLALSSLFSLCLYLTVVLGTYNSEDIEILSDKHLHMFYNTWKKYDPDVSQYIPYR